MESMNVFLNGRNIIVSVMFIVLLSAFYIGCGQTQFDESFSEDIPQPMAIAPPYYGEITLEETILLADVIARVKLNTSTSTVERGFQSLSYPIGSYYTAEEIKFKVMEYLKGNGNSEIDAIIRYSHTYETQIDAEDNLKDMKDMRDRRWDDREAIVFLWDTDPVLSTTEQEGRYSLGTIEGPSPGDDGYSITSIRADRWLPAALDEGVSGASGGADQRFLTEDPDIARVSGASGVSANAQTITLSKIKERIADIENELDKGNGSEMYRSCLIDKYYAARLVRWHIDNYGPEYYQFNRELNSGSQAGSVLYSDRLGFGDLPDKLGKYWLEGEDADLFISVTSDVQPHDMSVDGNVDSVKYSRMLSTARPLPAGEYDFYLTGIPSNRLLCEGVSDVEKNLRHWIVTVTSPDGTLHEAFFDPVDLDGGAVGVGSGQGILESDRFLFKTDTLIERIEWKDGEALMEFKSHRQPPDHHIDFIGLDGSVALRLDFDEARKEGAGAERTLVWGVCEQPWKEGDLLMIRMSESEPGLSGATNDGECGDAPSPEPGTEPTVAPPGVSTTTRDTVE